jgi:hypothetical protein
MVGSAGLSDFGTKYSVDSLRVEEGDAWKYITPPFNINISSNSISEVSHCELYTLEGVDVSGYDKARIFVSLTEKDFFLNKGRFVTGKSRVEIVVSHPSGVYLRECVTANAKTAFSGCVEVPVISTHMRVAFIGYDLPKSDMDFSYSIYLLKP